MFKNRRLIGLFFALALIAVLALAACGGDDDGGKKETKKTPTAVPTVEATEVAAPVVTEAAAPVVTEAAAPVVTQEAAPVVTEAAAPVVTEAAAPAATQEVAMAVTEAAAPAVTEEAAAPAATEEVAPAATEEVAMAPAATEEVAPAATEEVAAPVATEAPEIIAPDLIDCTKYDLSSMKIGLVTDVGQINDKSFNQSSWEGVLSAETCGAEVNYIETQDAVDYADNIAEFAEQDYNIIVTVGFALGTATAEAAATYPDITFIGVDQFQGATLPNVIGLIFHEDQSGYLAGVLAARLTQSGTIAAVLGTDQVPPVVAFKEGYEAGARSVNPDINIISTYHPGAIDQAFTDPEWGATTARQALDQGADVVFGAGGKTGNGALIEVANAVGAGGPPPYCIGVDSDQWLTVPEAHPCLVSSAMKLLDKGVAAIIMQLADGNVPAGNFFGDAGLAPLHDFSDVVPQDIQDELATVAAGLKAGTISTGYGVAAEPAATEEAAAPVVTEEAAPVATEEAAAALAATEEVAVAMAPAATEEVAPAATEEVAMAPAATEEVAPAATEEVAAPAATEEVAAPVATEAPEIVAPELIDCTKYDLSSMKIGLVTDVGQINDKSFNQSSWEGVLSAETCGAEVNYIETQDAVDYADNIAEFAEQDYNIIVTVGFALGTATAEAAATYPDITFIGVDQFQGETLPNVIGLIFHEDQSGYLAGVLAARLTQSGTIAAVLGTDQVPPVVAFKEGYEAGARSVNPDINIISTYHPGAIDQAFTDPEWGATTARQALDQGADVVFGAGGKTGNGALIEVANAVGAGGPPPYCIGVDSDQWLTVPEAHPCLVSSAMKLLDKGVAAIIMQLADGNVPAGNFFGDAGLAPLHDFTDVVPQDIQDELATVAAGLKDGTISTGYGVAAEPAATEEAAAPEAGGTGADLGVITVGTNAEYPPFEFVDENNNVVGFDMDMLNAIAEKSGFSLNIVNTRWDGIFVALQSGEFDVVCSAATITAEREEIVDFSNPYFNAGQMIAVRESDANTISKPEDLVGLRVGVQAGTTGDIAISAVQGVEVVRYDEITLAFQALGAGEIDAIVNDGPVSADIIAKNPELGAVLVGDPFTDELYGIAVQPDKPELLDAINSGLAAIIADGTYADIYEKWFGMQPPSAFRPTK